MKWKIGVLVFLIRTLPLQAGGVFVNSSFNNPTGTTGNGWATLTADNFRVTEMNGGPSLWVYGDPVTDDAHFQITISGSGIFVPEDELPTPGSGTIYTAGTSGSLHTHQITAYDFFTGDTQIYDFSPSLALNWNATSWFSSGGEGDPNWYGNMSANVWANGGIFTASSIDFRENEWTGEGPPPGWWPDASFTARFDGLITATNFTAVPEPASLALMGTGAGAALLRKRRR